MLQEEHGGHIHQNSEMAAAAKGMESGVFCFFYC